MAKSYIILTYGCQMNKSDSERVAGLLEKNGYKTISRIDRADLIVVNMCSVRQSAVDRILALSQKLSALKKKKPGMVTVLTGCVLKADRTRLSKCFNHILNIKDLADWPVFRKKKTSYLKVQPKYAYYPVVYVPISSGCNNFCTYCVVPFTRGREFFRPEKEVLDEIKRLVKNGFKDIVLLGHNVNSRPNFVKLLQKITAIRGDFQVKFIANNPKDFSETLINELARNEKLAKYVHLPAQSGDNSILKKMNRRYTREQYLALARRIKKKMPNVELTTDVIVGFPGETRRQFQNTVKLFKEIGFSDAFIAKYSPRPGTAAYLLKDNVPPAEKKRREQVLRKQIL